MAKITDLELSIKKIDLSKATTVYALSDGHIFIDGKPEAIIKIAIDNDLEIFTIKGQELTKPAKPKSKDESTGS